MGNKVRMAPRMLKVRDVAEALGLDYQAALKLAKSHLIWHQFKKNGTVYIEADSFTAFLKEHGFGADD